MGQFLALSGVIAADNSSVLASIDRYVRARNGTFERTSDDWADGRDIAVIGEDAGNSTVLYPPGFCEWDEIAQHLSQELLRPVFSFHIHDGDLWMFIVFNAGIEVAWFNPIPGYWSEVDAAEEKKWAGNADEICRLVPNVSVESIRNYFVSWNDDGSGPTGKAYEDDEFAYCSDWQMVDFMRRIGLTFPLPSDGAIHGEKYVFRIPKKRRTRPSAAVDSSDVMPPVSDSPASTLQKRPWWKFW